MGNEPVAIDYAPADKARNRARLIRRLVAAIVVAVAALLVVRRPVLAWLDARRLLWADMRAIQRCNVYRAPEDQVIWESLQPVITGSRPVATRSYRVVVPSEWRELWPRRSGLGPSGLAFLHGRTDRQGRSALLCIEFVPEQSNRGPHLAAVVIEQGSLFRARRHEGPSVGLDLAPQLDTSFKIYAGQPDPADESHFTIPYQLGDESGVFDGWLEPAPAGAPAWQKWTVRMQRRPGPATRGAASGLQTQSAGPQ